MYVEKRYDTKLSRQGKPRLHAIIALVAVVILQAACGGGSGGSDSSNSGNGSNGSNGPDANYTVGGTVAGLNGELELNLTSSNVDESLLLSTDGGFQFNAALKEGNNYNVSVDSKPSSQNCTIDNASGTIQRSDINSISVECTDIVAASAKVSGSIVAAAGIDYDTDVNDPYAPYTSNTDATSPQALNNNVIKLHGFASAENMENFNVDGVFAQATDADDFFSVSLQANQRIVLQVVDYDFYAEEQPFKGDLDLFLYRYSDSSNQYELVDYSNEEEEFEEILTPSSGEYIIQISAYEGASKYVMQLEPSVNSSAKRADVEFVSGEMLVKFQDNTSKTLRHSRDLQTHVSDHSQKITLNLSHQDFSRSVLVTMDLDAVSANQKTKRVLATTGSDKTIANDEFLTLQMIKRMGYQQGVEYAEPNFVVQPLAIPNDEFYSLQWHYPLINLPQAWDITTGISEGEPVIVAVIDSGVFLNHSDLQGKLVPGYDFISNTQSSGDGDGIDSNPDDPGNEPQRGRSSWHGTHVAGTVAAATNNNIGFAGVSWGAQVMPIRVLGQVGGTTNDINQGIRFAAGLSNSSGTLPSSAADIINLSLGGYGRAQSLEDAINQARDAGVIIIASAGNDDTEQPSYPAAFDGSVSVSAVTLAKERAYYSNYGDSIDIAAPGGDISVDNDGDGYVDGVLSAVADDTNGERTSSYRFYQGTSMAAPHVAGVAALMRAVHPGLTPAEFDSLIASGNITEDLGDAGWDILFGYGLIDAHLAVIEAQRLANGGSAPVSPAQLLVSPTSIVLGMATTANLQLSNGGDQQTLSGITFSEIPSWLEVNASNVDSNGLGTYQLSVNRNGLVEGSYRAVVTIDYQRGGELDSAILNVTMDVGTVNRDGRLNTQFVILMRADTLETVDTILAEEINGQLSYQFDNVGPGEYYVLSGTDVDNDLYLCQSGESCGGYPSLSEAEIISVSGENVTDLDIVVNILGGSDIGALNAASSALSSTRSRHGIKRHELSLTDKP